MTLDEALHYIHEVCWKGSVPGLERISALLDVMGHPERQCKFVHVTGTNGKGSTCAMVASILRKAGYEVKTKEFLRIGVPFTLLAVLVGYLFCWFIWS